MGEVMEGFLEWFLESSLLVLMIFGIRKVFTGKIRYAGIYALWFIVFLRFLVPVNFISTPLSVGNIVQGLVSSWTVPEASDQENKNSDFLGDNLQQERGTGEIVNLNSAGMVSEKYQQIKSTENNRQSDSFSEKSKQKQSGVFAGLMKMNWQRYLKIGWLAISTVLFLWLVMSNLCLMRKLKRSRVLYGMRNHLKIYAVSGIKNPCLYGFFRPVIYLPKALVQDDEGWLDEKELEQIITHEYVHYQHRDNIQAMLRMLLISVYWFDPFLWLAISCSKKDAELFCDETVIRQLGEENRLNYGLLLIRMAGDASWGDFRYSMLLMSRRGREMEKRIRAISERRYYSKWILIPLVIVVFAAMGITCSAGLASFAKAEKITDQTEAEKRADLNEGKELLAVNRGLEGQTANPLDWLNGFDQSSMFTFYTNPHIGGKPENLLLQNNVKASSTDFQEKIAFDVTVYSNTYEEAFEHYLEIFTEAVNTGNVDKMHLVLAVDSDVYKQQSNLAKNYYKRGIREKVKSFSISLISETEGVEADQKDLGLQKKIDSREVIKVFYADGSAKTVRQKYRYTCECIDENWVIIDMEEISE